MDTQDRHEFILCSCYGEGLLLTEVNYKGNKEVYLAMFTRGQLTFKPSLWERIKYAWKHLITGKKHEDEVVLERYDIKKVINFLERALENEDR